jgi:hypothetical protein
MLDEKKRIELGKQRTLAYLIMGGNIEEDKEVRRGIPGIDFPVSESDMNF